MSNHPHTVPGTKRRTGYAMPNEVRRVGPLQIPSTNETVPVERFDVHEGMRLLERHQYDCSLDDLHFIQPISRRSGMMSGAGQVQDRDQRDRRQRGVALHTGYFVAADERLRATSGIARWVPLPCRIS
jgi:hypothetical protein